MIQNIIMKMNKIIMNWLIQMNVNNHLQDLISIMIKIR